MSYPPDVHSIHGALPPGTRLNANYEIDAFLKAGGMGDVYRGHEIETGDTVAIKLIRDQLAGDEAVLAMFRNEALALRRIHHEAIVRYFGFTLEPQLRRHYLAMEFVEGQPLSDILDRGPLPAPQVLALMRRVAAGLQAAHEQNVVHRDISPDNIIVPQTGIARSRIIDFGIARSLRVGDSTVIGSGFAGKYKYVSPEQLGLFGGDVRAASDIYSLGLVLAACLIGKPLAMDGTQVEVIERRRVLPDLSAIDPMMRPIIAAMLQPDPEARPRSMAELAAWTPDDERGSTVFAPRGPRATPLTPVPVPPPIPVPIGSAPVPAPPPKPVSPTKAEKPRRVGVLVGSLLGVVALAAAGFGGWRYLHHDEPATTTEVQTTDVSASNAEPPLVDPPQKPAETRPDPFVRLREYARDFDGGDCFLAVVGDISAGEVQIDGYGRGREPFDALDKSFKDAMGVPAAISVRKVTAPQCPALGFAKKFLAIREPLRFDVARTQLQRAGDRLEGAIETNAENVRFLIVDDDGLVNDLSGRLGQETGRRDFAMELRATRQGPVLLVAIAGATPISIASAARAATARDVFARLAEDLAGVSPPPSVALKYVLLVSGR
ncbi:serine/threonine protein kinase [Methylosinus sp. H3A]|uniref:serine/threonine-protein kinase n=1 Tax=Methylosinus sp. H3A TaxID=2785786 RepID=UPI0018C211FD|nr:serine/threonine-protein kinase [Methylosinus sp. H3A]MBG0809500.1 serine/threonine protein kinase [Methylosinus sp. H3A]